MSGRAHHDAEVRFGDSGVLTTWWWNPAWMRAVLVFFAAVATAVWIVFAELWQLPGVDDQGRLLLRYRWQLTLDSWQALAFSVASLASLVFLVLALIAISWRLSGALRWIVATAGTAAWLVSAAYLAICALILSITPGDVIVLDTGQGDRVVLTQQLIEVTHYRVWIGGTGYRFVNVPNVEVIDPRSGLCEVMSQDNDRLLLTCGSSSQVLSPVRSSPTRTSGLPPFGIR